MSPLVFLINSLSSWLSGPAVWGVFLAGAVIYLVAEWRIRLLAFLTQYFFIGILFARVFADRPEMALLKMMVGWLVCGALYLSARIRQEAGVQPLSQFHWAADLPFRVLSLILITLVAILASQRYTLPFVSTELALACFFLVVLAVLFIGTEEDPVVVGGGALNLLAALDIFYSAQDPGLLVTGLLVMVNLLLGLAISYLTVVEVTE
ncbi:MAG: hypothetical protein RBT47_00830 [Anaerolineae bacterium]|jgi:hypothetical protein|nr:hypothetical protein [Anaerolineae bacterium]